MISLVVEIFREILIRHNYASLYLLIALYFWMNWAIKWAYSRRYHPIRTPYNEKVTVVMPVYHEDRQILEEAIRRVLAQPLDLVTEVIIVTDAREPDLKTWVRSTFGNHRIITVETQKPGKRQSLDLGIKMASNPIIVSIESDVYIRPDTVSELIKPFANVTVGGVVGDQEVYDPHRTIWTWFDFIAEKTKYALIYPALGSKNEVTVLSGRAVAYRKEAVMPLLEGLTEEKFLGKVCFAGDDGRLTSLLLAAGWKTAFQSTSVVETVSPPTMGALFAQRLRWFRNTSRRTLRALTGSGEGFWVYSKPLALWHMLLAWSNTIMMVIMVYALCSSIAEGYFFWFGKADVAIALRLGILFIGLPITRFLRSLPGLTKINLLDWRIVLLLVLPWYLLALWFVRLWAIVTSNQQGWVTRTTRSAGGFAPNGNGKK